MKKRNVFQKKKLLDNVWGYVFLMPALISFILFIGLPIIIAFSLSFFDYNLIQLPKFIGLYNIKQFLSDPDMWQIFLNTFKFLLILTPMHCILGLILAYLVYRVKRARLRNIFRGIIYFPAIVTTASVAIVWGYMFATDMGLINYYLKMLGMLPVPWLTNTAAAYMTIAFFSFWKFIGTTFLYYFIGLNHIPVSYYESAMIDGANSFQVFRRITIPLLSPTIFFVMVTNIIGVFQIFNEPYFLTDGGPGISTTTVALKIYRTAFVEMNMGYGATIAFVVFIIILLITCGQFILQKKWVVYDYE